MKSVYTIAQGAPFLETLAKEIWRRAEGDSFQLSRFLILLPTRRACRHLGTVFARLAEGKPVLLPRMRPLGDVDEDELIFADEAGFDIPPAIAPLRRLMLLAEQVRRRDPGLSWDQAAESAQALAGFLDQIQIEQCDISALPLLVEEQELAEHWQQTLAFLDIVTRHWPSILEAQGCLDPAQRRNAVLAAQAQIWRDNSPDFPVIAAGSTGSVPATAVLLEVIASLPQGAVILPGLDRDIDAEAWDEISDTHPQHSMKRLLGKMDVAREAVALWGENPAPSARLRLLREAMRPAALTEAWRGLRGQLDDRVVQGLTRVTLAHPQEEAQVIALRLRAVLEDPDKTAAFVTADRYLAMRVAALLQRWGIEVDDSGGASLGLLPLGAFLNLVLAAASPYARAVDFLALLKHPLTACGLSPALCRMQAREAERRARQGGEENFAALRKILEPLTESARSPLALVERIDAHVRVAETLAASDTESGAARLWRGETGADAALWLDEWRASAVDFPALSGADYAVLFKSLAATKTLRSLRATHPRLSILGPLEARLIDADCLVLGAMNESVWPPDPGFDPWMSRQMRQKFKLPAPEFRIGLSAHDFTQLVAAREVMVTRALRSEGTPTVPSRFLLQIETVLRAAGISEDTRDALAPVEPWREWAQALDMPQAITPCERPRPCPPVALRPTALSVTEVTTWLRNPYAIYAKHILKLKKLDELDAELDAADKGTMIHAALEEFARAYPGVLPVDAEARLLEIGQKVFRQNESNPRVRAFWWARFKDVAVWFVETERQRRAQGIRFLAAEPEGVLTMQGLTLKGRADRMDRLATGELAIIDYKTGGVPTQAEVVSGLEPQLQLLALIAEKGGFSSIPPAVSGALEYWVLKGGRSGCARQVQKEKIEDLVARAEEGVRNLVAAFADPATPYEAVPKPRIHPRYNDYAHLSRLAEWGRTGRES